MRVGSLFAGVGGFDLAAERAGMTVAWQVEIDPYASRVLAHHWPDVKRFDDVHTISLKDGGLYERAADVDVLAGGFPCQDYSVAGNRGGLAGDRGALWWQFRRLIVEGHPTWVVGENVPGLLSSRGGADFATIIDSLTECGYGVVWGCLDAQYFGVAQRRRRVFIVGHSGGVPRPEVLALGEGLFGHPEPRREAGQDVTGTLAARTRGGGGLGTDFDLAGGVVVHATQDPVVSVGHTAGLSANAYQAVAVNLFNNTLTGDLHVPLRTAGGHGAPAVIHGPTVRRLTPLELERLQGFPDGWTSMVSDTQRARQMGNAVAVPVAEWLMRRIKEAADG